MQTHVLCELGNPSGSGNRGVDGGFDGGGFDHVGEGGQNPPPRQQRMWEEPAHIPWDKPTILPMQNKNIVRTLRTKRGLKQAELAAELGISRSHLSKVENGSDAPGRQLLEAMAVYFRVPVDTFFPNTMAGIAEEGAPPENREAELLALWRALRQEEQDAFLTLLRRRK